MNVCANNHMSPTAPSATPSRLRPAAESETIHTNIPARLDRLPWSRFHWLMVIALGVAWILDGLEVTIVGAIGPVLEDPQTLALSAAQVGNRASSYTIGAVIGACCFGWLTDRFGRRVVFYTTLVVYLTGVLLTAASGVFQASRCFVPSPAWVSAVNTRPFNSAIDELIPARYRGCIDLIVNGSFWLGTVAGSSASLLFLDSSLIAPDLGWRLGFGIGGLLGLGVLLMRRHVPRKPALATNGLES
jgi:MFS family permease